MIRGSQTIPHPIIETQGEVWRYRPPAWEDPSLSKGGGLRGRIQQSQQSRQSRRRMMERSSQIGWEYYLQGSYTFQLITLTVPQSLWSCLDFVNRAFRSVQRDIRKRDGFDIWRRELGKKNGALHFHLLCVFPKGNSYSPQRAAASMRRDGQNELARMWSNLLGWGCVRVEVEQIFNEAQARKYICKYCAKVTYNDVEKASGVDESECPQDSSEPAPCLKAHKGTENVRDTHNGRAWWGMCGRSIVRWAESIQIDLDAQSGKAVWVFRRILRLAVIKRAKRRMMWAACKKAGFEWAENDSTSLEAHYLDVFGKPGQKRLQVKCAKNHRGYEYLRRGGRRGFMWIDDADMMMECWAAALNAVA